MNKMKSPARWIRYMLCDSKIPLKMQFWSIHWICY